MVHRDLRADPLQNLLQDANNDTVAAVANFIVDHDLPLYVDLSQDAMRYSLID